VVRSRRVRQAPFRCAAPYWGRRSDGIWVRKGVYYLLGNNGKERNQTLISGWGGGNRFGIERMEGCRHRACIRAAEGKESGPETGVGTGKDPRYRVWLVTYYCRSMVQKMRDSNMLVKHRGGVQWDPREKAGHPLHQRARRRERKNMPVLFDGHQGKEGVRGLEQGRGGSVFVLLRLAYLCRKLYSEGEKISPDRNDQRSAVTQS